MSEQRRRHYGELAVDLAIVVGCVLYIHTAGHYPPQGRRMPTIIGYIGLGLGVLHLIAHVVPQLWAVTHDSRARSAKPRTAVPEQVAARSAAADVAGDAAGDGDAAVAAVPGGEAAGPAPVSLKVDHGDGRQVLVAMAWTVGLLVAVYVVGYEVAVPAFFLAYYGAMRAWKTAVISAVAMAVVTMTLFETALAVPLPHGLL
jgi:Tripartite tricarboxylate transporter TctB family